MDRSLSEEAASPCLSIVGAEVAAGASEEQWVQGKCHDVGE